jgi:hypothetical protein
MPQGTKHLIRCRCVLPQFKNLPEPPQHQFVVFSVIEDDDKIRPKFVQCNNCGIIHKIIDVCKSEITPREDMGALVTIDNIKVSMPANLVGILETNYADLPTWEAAQFIYDNKRWGEFVVLAADTESGTRQGKYLQILGENLFKVNAFSREEYAR